MNYRPCEHIASSATLEPFATLTFGDIKAALCSACLAAEVNALSSVLTPTEIGAALAFHSGAKATREPGDDCISITNDLLRNDAAGDKARAAVKKQRLEAQRRRTFRPPAQSVRIVPPTQQTTVA